MRFRSDEKKNLFTGSACSLGSIHAFVGGDHDRGFGRFADRSLTVGLLLQASVVALQSGPQQRHQIIALSVIELLAGCFKVAGRVVTHASHIDFAGGQPDSLDSHLVLPQRTCFVRTNG